MLNVNTKQLVEFTTKGFKVIDEGKRWVEGIATAEVVDKHAEVALVKAFMKTVPAYLQSSASLIDWHSNRPVGKVHEVKEIMLKGDDGSEVPAVKIKGEIFNRGYVLDDTVWDYIKSGTYKGFSFGGAIHQGGKEAVEVGGRMAYALKDMELYEISVCPSPVNPLAIITNFNAVAKAEGKPVCTSMGCYHEVESTPEVTIKSDVAITEEILTPIVNKKVEEYLINKGFDPNKTKEIEVPVSDSVKQPSELQSNEIVVDKVKADDGMYINTKDINISKSEMTNEDKKVSETTKSDAPAPAASAQISATDIAKALQEAFAPTFDSIGKSLSNIDTKLTKALDTPTNFPASQGQAVAMPSAPYNGKSEQGGKEQGSKEPAETDKVVLEQKSVAPSVETPTQIIKTETPRPAVNAPTQIQKGSNPILTFLRKSQDGNSRFGVVSNKILYDQSFIQKALAGEQVL